MHIHTYTCTTHKHLRQRILRSTTSQYELIYLVEGIKDHHKLKMKNGIKCFEIMGTSSFKPTSKNLEVITPALTRER